MRTAPSRPPEGIVPEVGRAYNDGVRLRVHFERTGGLAGRRVEVSVDSQSLPPKQVRHLETLLARSRFFELPVELGTDPRGIDRFHFRITVEAGTRSHTVEAGEAAVPESMWQLLDFVTRHGA